MPNRSQPIPQLCGSTTPNTASAAMAASMAYPPRARTCAPACDASVWLVATIPRSEITIDRAWLRSCDSAGITIIKNSSNSIVPRSYQSAEGVARGVAGVLVTIRDFTPMLERSIQELESGSLARIASARSPEELEAVRVAVLGRKEGALTQMMKEMGKLPPEERKSAGKLINAAKQKLEEALASKEKQFAEAALGARLDAEWIDLTLPAPGP